MKIVQINSVCNGSTGKIACDLARKLEKEGHECYFVYGRGKAPSDIKTIKMADKLSILFHVLCTRLFDTHGFHSKLNTFKLVKWLKKYNPDTIYLHNIHGYYINIEILFDYLASCGKKVVWTLHDCWSFTGHCPHFEYENCNQWKCGCNKCPRLKEYPKNIFYSNVYKNYFRKRKSFTSLSNHQLKIITPSRWLANLVKVSFLSKYNIEIVNNTIDENIFKYTTSNILKKYGIENKKVILGVASVWNKKKGLEDFLVLSKRINDEYKIVLIGLNDKQIKNLPKNIIGIKRTESQNELVEWYSAAFCLFNPTYEDNYPTVLLEAKSCGCPTISYNVGGCGEIADYLIDKNVESFIKILKNGLGNIV